MDDSVLDFYAQPGRFTELPTELSRTLDDALGAGDIGAVVDAVQHLLVYDVVSQPLYGLTLTPVQADTIHERDTARVLEVALAIDPTPPGRARPTACRVGARCHLYSRLAVAFLRAAGVPSRARCGFATYFVPGSYEDHWVVEYFDRAERRWIVVDAQLDDTWRRAIGFTTDPLDVTPSQFVSAGHAWQGWRRGEVDADKCGLSAIHESGPHWLAGNLRLDLASLNKVEMNLGMSGARDGHQARHRPMHSSPSSMVSQN